MKDDKVFLQNILECIVKIETYLEIVGEATKRNKGIRN